MTIDAQSVSAMKPSFTARLVELPLAPVLPPRARRGRALVVVAAAAGAQRETRARGGHAGQKGPSVHAAERTDTPRLEGFPGVTAPGRSAHSPRDRRVGVVQHARNADRPGSGRPGARRPARPRSGGRRRRPGRWSGPAPARRGTHRRVAPRRDRGAGPCDRAAYWRICTVSMPARSLKNQPHDVYMSSAKRWASRRVRASSTAPSTTTCCSAKSSNVRAPTTTSP